MSRSVLLCSTGDVEAGTAKKFIVDEHRIALVRIKDEFYAIGDTCSHADFSLSEGDVFEGDREIECWKHGALFSLVTGEALSLPATRPVPTYNVKVENDDVYLELP